MLKTANIEDMILEEYRKFKLKNKSANPRYIIIDRNSYRLLKDIFDIPEYEEIATYYGWMISIVPEEQTHIEFI
ncbi:MAG: hypothetical protein KatS3mg002_1357 [Candidatus Woesearchaeota archaeon]|nr:MAG: hypothetical protein KatS3mg002_1357 [Candidatus Woesearchaeota archaeon]